MEKCPDSLLSKEFKLRPGEKYRRRTALSKFTSDRNERMKMVDDSCVKDLDGMRMAFSVTCCLAARGDEEKQSERLE